MIPNLHGHQQAKAVANLISHGAIEGTDWRIGDSPIDWHGQPCVIEFGPVIGVNNDIRPADPHALPVLIRSSAVRLLGVRQVADKMDAEEFPEEMPYALEPYRLDAN
jgi:hypothetical protein